MISIFHRKKFKDQSNQKCEGKSQWEPINLQEIRGCRNWLSTLPMISVSRWFERFIQNLLKTFSLPTVHILTTFCHRKWQRHFLVLQSEMNASYGQTLSYGPNQEVGEMGFSGFKSLWCNDGAEMSIDNLVPEAEFPKSAYFHFWFCFLKHSITTPSVPIYFS